jgi:hypothetical protein
MFKFLHLDKDKQEWEEIIMKKKILRKISAVSMKRSPKLKEKKFNP